MTVVIIAAISSIHDDEVDGYNGVNDSGGLMIATTTMVAEAEKWSGVGSWEVRGVGADVSAKEEKKR